jgi:hypothetical protein
MHEGRKEKANLINSTSIGRIHFRGVFSVITINGIRQHSTIIYCLENWFGSHRPEDGTGRP